METFIKGTLAQNSSHCSSNAKLSSKAINQHWNTFTPNIITESKEEDARALWLPTENKISKDRYYSAHPHFFPFEVLIEVDEHLIKMTVWKKEIQAH